jgi:hypothetical protein
MKKSIIFDELVQVPSGSCQQGVDRARAGQTVV